MKGKFALCLELITHGLQMETFVYHLEKPSAFRGLSKPSYLQYIFTWLKSICSMTFRTGIAEVTIMRSTPDGKTMAKKKGIRFIKIHWKAQNKTSSSYLLLE